MNAVLETSVIVGVEQGRGLKRGELPDAAAVSIITIAELLHGVHMAAEAQTRAERERSLRETRADMFVLAIDESVAEAYAKLRAELTKGRRRVRLHDLWIAATAIAHGVPLYTQDGDFAAMGVDVVRV